MPTKPATIEENAATVLAEVLRHRKQMDRIAFCMGTLQRADVDHLKVAVDWCIERGFLTYGSTSSAAKRGYWGGASDSLLYISKAGKAWLFAEREREMTEFKARLAELKARRLAAQGLVQS